MSDLQGGANLPDLNQGGGKKSREVSYCWLTPCLTQRYNWPWIMKIETSYQICVYFLNTISANCIL